MTWNKKTDVFALMVGHGTQLNGVWDSGCTYGNYTEADLMLKIVKVAVKMLRLSGVRVITDADKGNNRNMKSSVSWANKTKGIKYYISLHCDYKLASAGVAPLFRTAKDKKMAVAIGKKVAKSMGMKWKGAFKRTDLYELNAPVMTKANCIFETGAIKADLKYLKDYKKYGKALAKAICSYIGVTYYVKPNSKKLADAAKKICYATPATKAARYPKGSPKDEYKKALNKVFPDRKKWGAPSRAGASCDVCAATIIRTSGVDKKFPRCLSEQYGYLAGSKKFQQISKPTAGKLKDGDIIIYKRPNNKGHICMYVGGKIKHAAHNKWYPRTTKNVKAMLSMKNKSFVKVYRAK